MLYSTLRVGEKEYKLRVTAKIAVDIERKIGKPLLSIFGEGNLNELPGIETLLIVLHGALQTYEHGISLEDVYCIYDKYVEGDGSYAGLLQELVEVLKISGFFKGAPKESKTE
ncbi:DUF6096 family protein [Paenibacillus alvei]|uniref:DUF6096 family protein n=1 Tax=Paenibacillus alvei TaxID=44250 RepID=UPI000288BCDE|nr:DUF6096 family protein [Paenibacillus alvei]EJW14284.1 hypothetical protein PAV_15c00730 [Paenibacillus alvei DSM 29]MCY9539233.1 DUF6096 family protein [Paenibacillus alvei]MCY9706721.1 DUF6096 family protein [Paenibacillus alvei]MCY9736998.1 DUF6096 family protein [Paenibacillus alvei]MCY9758808.1 DUF6096 family protein [Paenibacillus alvei]